jgi:hypothetical protein
VIQPNPKNSLPTSIANTPVARAALRVLRLVRTALVRTLEALLAVIIVFEEWGWRPLAAALASLARLAPVAKIEAAIVALPPYPALVVFAGPSLLVLPLKLASLWLIAHGHVVLATGLFIGAKIVGTALLARIFQLTQPALMRLAWFAWTYETVMPWKAALVARVRASWAWRFGRVVKERVKRRARAMWLTLQPSIEPWIARLRALFARP